MTNFTDTKECFGLTSASAASQRVLSTLLKYCQQTISYLDDVLVHRQNKEPCDTNLCAAFSALVQSVMTLNRQKYCFAVMELDFRVTN